ncbi:MAG: hypothetical protein ACI9HE_002829 [Planctomycetota bacterium]|jgi:hypothetical protein
MRSGRVADNFFGCTGRVVRDRYHAKPKFGRAAVRYAITYVLQNARKNKVQIAEGEWGSYCSARFSKGLVDAPPAEWPVILVCWFYAHARAALRTIRPDIYPGHMQLRA